MKISFVIIILTLYSACFSQQKKIVLDAKVKGSVINTYTGNLLLKTTEGIQGINPEKKQIIWNNSALNSVNFVKYKEIPFTPYVMFDDKPLLNSKLLSKSLNVKGISRIVLDATNGKIIFDSKELGFNAVFNTFILPADQKVLIDGVNENGFGVGLYDFKNNRMVWFTSIESSFFSKTKGALFNAQKVRLDRDNSIFWLRNRQLLKIDFSSGKLLHDQKGVTSFLLNKWGDELYLTTNRIKAKKLNQESAVYAYNPRNMASIWPNATVKIAGNVKQLYLDDNQLVMVTNKGFNVVNKNNGRKKWSKSDPLPLIKKIVPLDKDYLVVQENVLTRVNQFGKKSWKKPVRITYSNEENPVHLFYNGSTVFYITPSHANRIKPDTGEKIWDEDLLLYDVGFINRNLKLKLPNNRVWINSESTQFPLFHENNFYILNNTDLSPPDSIYRFNFKNNIPRLKVRKDSYFLFEGNNYYSFDFSGNLKYKKEYASLKTKTSVGSVLRGSYYWLRRGLAISSAAVLFAPTQVNNTFRNTIVSDQLGFLSSGASNIYGTFRTYSEGLEKLQDLNIDADSSLEYVFKRLKQGLKNEDTMIISVPKADKVMLISFNIDTGKEVVLENLPKPKGDLLVDEVAKVYYVIEGEEIFIGSL